LVGGGIEKIIEASVQKMLNKPNTPMKSNP
jgi:hypothetical protein